MVRAQEWDQDRAMTETSQQDHVDPDGANASRVNTDNFRDYTELRRSVTDRKVAGVAGGLGRHWNIDPTIVRVVLVVLCFFGGAGFLLYGAVWALVPEEGQMKGNVSTSPSTRNALLIVAAVFAALLLVGDSWGGFGFPWPLAILAVIVFVVLMNRDTTTNTQASNTAASGGDTATLPETSAQPPIPPWMPPTRQAYEAPGPAPERGPKLFWITLALVAVALGSLGLYETAVGAVTDAAYPALALAVIGAMLIVGAWVGRAGGLIFLGVVAAVALAITSTVVPRFDGERTIDVVPAQAAQVRDSYYVPAGSIHVDLSGIENVRELDGRLIDLEANAGEIVVTVPEGVSLDVTADVSVVGEAVIFGEEANGPDVYLERSVSEGTDSPELELDIHLLVGSIEVRQS